MEKTELGYDIRARVIKAEILWTKKCPFSCSFCGMVQSTRNEKLWTELRDRWEIGIKNLKNIGCEFTAIYGAEPLTKMDGLDEFIKIEKDLNIAQTIITALYKPDKIKTLINAGLDSLTVSYDMRTDDKSRKTKALNGIKLLQEFPNISDRACVATLTKQNQDVFLGHVSWILENGFWFLFDIVHPGYQGVDPRTGYNLSKCIGSVEDMAPDVGRVDEIISTLIRWKEAGKKIHASVKLLDDMATGYWNAGGNVREVYHCGKAKSLGWVTVGPDLELYACDDFQLEYNHPLDEMLSDAMWIEFFKWRSEVTQRACPGCCWNTHFNTHEIIESGCSGSYVHSKQDIDLTVKS